MDDTKRCPYCGEEIRAAAVRCRYCRSRLTSFDPERWHRNHGDARLAGVCSALAHALAVPVAAVRLLFVVLSFVHFLGPTLYGGLWLIIPRQAGEESLLERFLKRALDLAALLGGRRNGPPGPKNTIQPSAINQRL
jgi:phage shock protein PspC (stress-responsive transcriptional regulator)